MAGREFYDDPWLRQRVATELAESEQPSSPYDVSEVIRCAIDVAAYDLRDRAGDMRGCNKADGCRGTAAVLDRLAAWLSERGAA